MALRTSTNKAGARHTTHDARRAQLLPSLVPLVLLAAIESACSPSGQRDAAVEEVATCTAGQTDCEGQCVDTNTNAQHCGACGVACNPVDRCDRGRCVSRMMPDAGMDVMMDVPAPEAGPEASMPEAGPEAMVSDGNPCSPGQALCNGSCLDVLADPFNCGACTRRCASGMECSAGVCVCSTGGELCGGRCALTSVDALNCGRCGNACGILQRCAMGTCVCDFSATTCMGQCRYVGFDLDHCAGCGMPCGPGLSCVAGRCLTIRSCAEARMMASNAVNNRYVIDPDGDGPNAPYEVYCEQRSDGGGWTLAAKIDGASMTSMFTFDSPLWTNEELLNPMSNNNTREEAKLRPFVSMRFTAIRIEMYGGSGSSSWTRSMRLNWSGDSLAALFSGERNQYASTMMMTTPLGDSADTRSWEGLVRDGVFHSRCTRQGINLVTERASVRLGLLGDDDMDCNSPDSWVGLGARAGDMRCMGLASTLTAGNACGCGCEGLRFDAAQNLPAFAHIYVR